MENQFVIFGLGQFGIELAKQLMQLGAEVLTIDRDFDIIESVKTMVTRAVCMSSTDESSLHTLDIVDFEAAIVAIGNDIESSILTTAILRRIGLKKIIARATTPLHGEILKVVGAHRVLFPEIQAAEETARFLTTPQVHEEMKLGEHLSIVEITISESMIGKTLKEVDIRSHYNMIVLEIRRIRYWVDDKGKTNSDIQRLPIPDHNERLREEDALLVATTSEDLKKYEDSLSSLRQTR